MGVRIGELLLKEKRITPEQLQETLNYQRQNGGKLGLNLIKLGHVKDEEIMALLSRQYVRFSNNATNPVFHYDLALRRTRFAGVSTPYIISQLTEL